MSHGVGDLDTVSKGFVGDSGIKMQSDGRDATDGDLGVGESDGELEARAKLLVPWDHTCVRACEARNEFTVAA